MAINPGLSTSERKILTTLGIDFLEVEDIKRLFKSHRHEYPILTRKVLNHSRNRRNFLARLEANPLGDFYSLSK